MFLSLIYHHPSHKSWPLLMGVVLQMHLPFISVVKNKSSIYLYTHSMLSGHLQFIRWLQECRKCSSGCSSRWHSTFLTCLKHLKFLCVDYRIIVSVYESLFLYIFLHHPNLHVYRISPQAWMWCQPLYCTLCICICAQVLCLTCNKCSCACAYS